MDEPVKPEPVTPDEQTPKIIFVEKPAPLPLDIPPGTQTRINLRRASRRIE